MSKREEIRVPDIGDFDKVPVIELLVSAGDAIEAEQSLITLESDKATMEVPAPSSGTLIELSVEEGDEVGEGDVIGVMEVAGGETENGETEDENGETDRRETEDGGDREAEDGGDRESEKRETGGDGSSAEKTASGFPAIDTGSRQKAANSKARKEDSGQEKSGVQAQASEPSELAAPPVPFNEMNEDPASLPHASPSVRRLAREMGVDLKAVTGSGRKSRITEDDLKAHVKQAMESPAGGSAVGGLAVADAPQVDFAKFGDIDEQPLSRIQKISGPNLHRNWVSIPHVTQFDEADISELEMFRKANQHEAEKADTKMTPVVFLIKAVVSALKAFPHVNASLSNDGQALIHKKYFHVGVAVDTPNGLVVPVLRDCDQKGLIELSQELTDLSGRAREGKLKGEEMRGGCFTISSLGGIGGTAFTPIINAPELAILGVSRAMMKPIWDGENFQPRLMLPLSLSYDHRVIDGADAARFNRYLAAQLEDLRRQLL